jgi:hypothetical protein
MSAEDAEGKIWVLRPGQCFSCADRVRLVDAKRLGRLDVLEPDRDSTELCPGGAPGVAAAFCPQKGVWFHANADFERVGHPGSPFGR